MADYSAEVSEDHSAAGATITVTFDGVSEHNLDQVTVKEVMLGESLLTPGLQTSVKFDSYLHNVNRKGVKNFDDFKNKIMFINIEKPSLAESWGLPGVLDVRQRIYRLDTRHLINNNTERFTLRACDDTQLNDPATLVSKSWKCTTPSDIVGEVLSDCVNARNLDIEPSDYARDYIAENIHPFQVVSQQAGYALAFGYDPSFVHYMTYEDLGTHHFRSLKTLSAGAPVMNYFFNEVNNSLIDPRTIMTYNFPCDFDLMSDILNGVDANGRDINSLVLFDPINKAFSLFNDAFGLSDCGIGSGVMKMAISNQNTYQQQDMCPDYAKEFLQKRQARMGLLDSNKIALRMTVPFNPILHAGKTIDVSLYNKEIRPDPAKNYGSGKYLILHMFHHIVNGGLATTTMDCVSSTVGQGIV